MKMVTELRKLKNELGEKFNIEMLSDNTLEGDFILQKWKDILSQIQLLLKEGRTTQCYQEIYLNINDLQIYPLPEEIKEQVDKAVQTLAFSITDEFYKINSESNFFQTFNPLWKTVIDRFNLIRKLFLMYERKAYHSFKRCNNMYAYCKFFILYFIKI
jgi:hypothetical protein